MMTVKLLWKGAECWADCLRLLSVAESTLHSKELDSEMDGCQNMHEFVVLRRGILRPAISLKNLTVLKENAQNGLDSCRIETIDEDDARNLVPQLHVPLNTAFYMPQAVNINSRRYLEALFTACENLTKESSTSGHGPKELYLQKDSINKLRELGGAYDAVIVCLGAKMVMLPELSGKLPLRTCRGVVAHMQLPDDISNTYPELGPSILSDAWLAIQGPRSLYMGSTWEWQSTNSSPEVSEDEGLRTLAELLPKVAAIYPSIKEWSFTGARAGLRAMPPLTPPGSLPLMGCIDEIVRHNSSCKYWLLGGLGSRGLLYHGWLGKLTAQAVLSCNEKLIPSELTSWKKMMNS
ncbi:uncharacterized protein LOC111007124 isoform X2 [Momordica charantia]|uniref:Uncharacterized protein LOC111007124 isoform X2 n=1 Tax=Momordica charantia TaxID=3673 RepID=A0A6J1C3N2_MOMCH|nr:uncharacterized protein LOC111007124 isoform X2 [Momordica charantia]XP_022135026.1 uncharacterized protein LOC111007124 isoform X2 [Momordica charantia]XP_022135027.1 uncharacterized protein LOC111007124 isoform X2 [Momordica charantia]XP_022135028.1 uncharacterized protein LOC111007124 isoform X2 [Momordica charantia]